MLVPWLYATDPSPEDVTGPLFCVVWIICCGSCGRASSQSNRDLRAFEWHLCGHLLGLIVVLLTFWAASLLGTLCGPQLGADELEVDSALKALFAIANPLLAPGILQTGPEPLYSVWSKLWQAVLSAMSSVVLGSFAVPVVGMVSAFADIAYFLDPGALSAESTAPPGGKSNHTRASAVHHALAVASAIAILYGLVATILTLGTVLATVCRAPRRGRVGVTVLRLLVPLFKASLLCVALHTAGCWSGAPAWAGSLVAFVSMSWPTAPITPFRRVSFPEIGVDGTLELVRGGATLLLIVGAVEFALGLPASSSPTRNGLLAATLAPLAVVSARRAARRSWSMRNTKSVVANVCSIVVSMLVLLKVAGLLVTGGPTSSRLLRLIRAGALFVSSMFASCIWCFSTAIFTDWQDPRVRAPVEWKDVLAVHMAFYFYRLFGIGVTILCLVSRAEDTILLTPLDWSRVAQWHSPLLSFEVLAGAILWSIASIPVELMSITLRAQVQARASVEDELAAIQEAALRVVEAEARLEVSVSYRRIAALLDASSCTVGVA